MGGGDTVVMFKDSPAAEALVKYLASPEAAEIWAAKGGFATLNKNVDASVYPDEITQTTAGCARRTSIRSASTSPTCSPQSSEAPSARVSSSSSRTS